MDDHNSVIVPILYPLYHKANEQECIGLVLFIVSQNTGEGNLSFNLSWGMDVFPRVNMGNNISRKKEGVNKHNIKVINLLILKHVQYT